MTETQKRRLNASLIEFVNRESVGRGERGCAGEIAETYQSTHRDLLRETGVTTAQLYRMIEYVLRVPYPQDLFLACEFDPYEYEIDYDPESYEFLRRFLIDGNLHIEDLAETDPVRISRLSRSEIRRMLEGLDLYCEESDAAAEREMKLVGLLTPFLYEKEAFENAVNRMIACYDRAVAGEVPRESWMTDLESLIAPVHLIQPELSTFSAFSSLMRGDGGIADRSREAYFSTIPGVSWALKAQEEHSRRRESSPTPYDVWKKRRRPPRLPGLSDLVREILLEEFPARLPDEPLIVRLSELVQEFLETVTVDQTAAAMIAEEFYRNNLGIEELARAVLGEAITRA